MQKQQGMPIPGPKERFLVGSAQEFDSHGPDFLVHLAEEYGDIAKFSMLGMKFVVLATPELIREVLITKAKIFPKAHHDIAVLTRVIGRGLVTTEGDEHKQQRKLAQPAFHAKRIRSYADTMVDYTAQLVDGWHPGETRDLSQEMSRLTMYIVVKTLFDVDYQTLADTADEIGDAVHVLQDTADNDFGFPITLPDWVPTPLARRRKKARKVVDAIIDQMMAERRGAAENGVVEDRGDLMSMLLMSTDEDGNTMNDVELRDQLLTLFLAGHETTSNALVWTWYALSQNPDVEQKLHDELDRVLAGRLPTLADLPNLPYAEMVLKESMRLYPPVWTINFREPTEDTTVGGYAVPKGTQMFISPYMMHRLERYWEDPLAFRPERFLPEKEAEMPKYLYMPFGAGARICIGNSFAMMEAHLILATIAQQYKLTLDPEQRIGQLPRITMSPTYGMKMMLEKRRATNMDIKAEMNVDIAETQERVLAFA
ncbi:MAG: cytochrome P450 [Chloroflexota bacterium]